jgi:hypothetical protein
MLEQKEGAPLGVFLELTQQVQPTWKGNEPGPKPFWAVGKKMPSFSCFPATQKRSHQRLYRSDPEKDILGPLSAK